MKSGTVKEPSFSLGQSLPISPAGEVSVPLREEAVSSPMKSVPMSTPAPSMSQPATFASKPAPITSPAQAERNSLSPSQSSEHDNTPIRTDSSVTPSSTGVHTTEVSLRVPGMKGRHAKASSHADGSAPSGPTSGVPSDSFGHDNKGLQAPGKSEESCIPPRRIPKPIAMSITENQPRDVPEGLNRPSASSLAQQSASIPVTTDDTRNNSMNDSTESNKLGTKPGTKGFIETNGNTNSLKNTDNEMNICANTNKDEDKYKKAEGVGGKGITPRGKAETDKERVGGLNDSPEKVFSPQRRFTERVFGAVSDGHLVELKSLLSADAGRRADVDIRSLRDEAGRTPLHCACELRQVGSMTLLVELAGMDVDAVDKDGWTGLHWLCKLGDVSAVRYMCKRGANISIADNLGRNPLHLACMSGQLDVVQYLISDLGCDPLTRDKEGYTTLHSAVAGNQVRVITFLLDVSQFIVFSVSVTGLTPVLLACKEGHLESLKYLIEKGGGDAQVQDTNGVDSLSMACWNGHINICRFLLTLEPQRRPRTDTKSAYGYTCLHYACLSGCAELVHDLLERGVDPNIEDSKGVLAADLTSNEEIKQMITSHINTLQLASTNPNKNKSSVSIKLPAGWIEYRDQSSGLPYYYNAELGKTQWEAPEDSSVKSLISKASSAGESEVSETVSQDKQQPRSSSSSGVLAPGWIELHDPTSGRVYYFNQTDRSTQWEKPVVSSGNGSVNEQLGDNSSQSSHRSTNSRTYTKSKSNADTGASVRSITPERNQSGSNVVRTPERTITKPLRTTRSPDRSGKSFSSETVPAGGTSSIEKEVFACACGGDMRGLYSLLGTAPNIKADVNVMRDELNRTPLHHACKHGQIRVIQFLVEGVGANVDAVDNEGWSSLHFACAGNHALVVRYLVKLCGVDLTLTDKDGRLAVSLAVQAADTPEDDDITRIITKAGKKSAAERRRVKIPSYTSSQP